MEFEHTFDSELMLHNGTLKEVVRRFVSHTRAVCTTTRWYWVKGMTATWSAYSQRIHNVFYHVVADNLLSNKNLH